MTHKEELDKWRAASVQNHTPMGPGRATWVDDPYITGTGINNMQRGTQGIARTVQIPPLAQARIDLLQKELERARKEAHDEAIAAERQAIIDKLDLEPGTKLYSHGSVMEVVWVKPLEEGGGVVVNVTSTVEWTVAEIEKRGWSLEEDAETRPHVGIESAVTTSIAPLNYKSIAKELGEMFGTNKGVFK